MCTRSPRKEISRGVGRRRGVSGREGKGKGGAGEYVHSPMISYGRTPLDKIYRASSEGGEEGRWKRGREREREGGQSTLQAV